MPGKCPHLTVGASAGQTIWVVRLDHPRIVVCQVAQFALADYASSCDSESTMGKVYEIIEAKLGAWILRQKIFFVATAPLARDGHVNCSPKGGDTFRVLGERLAAYLDLTGSGVETIAHVQENGRIVIMFCAFDGPPRIVRLHGKAEVLYPTHPDFDKLSGHFQAHVGSRAIVRIAVTRISDSCGYAVPLFDFAGDRDVLDKWAEAKGPEGLIAYRAAKNGASVDGNPGYRNVASVSHAKEAGL